MKVEAVMTDVRLQGWALGFAAALLFILPFTHTIALRTLFLLLVLGMTLYGWRRWQVPTLPCRWCFVVWLLLPLVLLPFAIDPAYSWAEVRKEILYGLAGFVTLFAVTQNDKSFKLLLLTLGVSLALMSLWALFDVWQQGRWFEGARYGGSANFSTYVITVLPLFVPAWFLFPSWRWLIALLVVVFLLAALSCAQRILVPVILAQTVVLGIWLARKQQVSVFRLSLFFLIVLGVAGLSFHFIMEHRFKSLSLVEVMMQDERVNAIERPIRLMAEKPLTGHGFGREAIRKVLPEEQAAMGNMWHAHNTILNYGVALGIPGIIILLTLFGCLLWHYWRLLKQSGHDQLLSSVAVAGVLVLLGVLLRNQVNDMFHRDLSLLFWCVNGMLLGFAIRRTQGQS